MRYPASEKLEIIRIIEQSHLSARNTLDQIGVPRATFYRWYDQYQTGGPEALEDSPSGPSRVWNRIPDDIDIRVEQMRRKTVAQRMRADALADSGPLGGFMDATVRLPHRDRISMAFSREQPAMRQHHATPLALAPPEPEQSSSCGESIALRSLRPLLCSTRISMHLLSMSSTLRYATSDTRSPAP